MSTSSASRPLVVVESPAKAKTISRFLGQAFDVRASVGHVADLPSKGMAIDVEHDFEPKYELTDRGRQVVKDLKAALKDASALYLATDEDREGEAISWHLLRELQPTVPCKRMVFHEITKSAIDRALQNLRDIHQGLVDAAETRRLLDRLYGYEVSPVLWRRVNRGLSAGRVQSPSIRLIVARERERMAFVRAPYWDVSLQTATAPSFLATLVSVGGTRVATGKDFGDDGRPKGAVVVVDQARAERLSADLVGAPVQVRSVDQKPYRSAPKAPFMTSTLQQEGGRKLRQSAAQVMRTAQGLYERGFITYMRTDSVVLSDEALGAVRAEIERAYGRPFVAPQVRAYASKIKNAQEAHEAIRPTTPLRSPEQVAGELDPQELALYRMIWQRTLASQMADATGTTVSVRLGAKPGGVEVEFAASGTTISFQGYRKVYVESADDAEASDEKEALLPPLSVGMPVPVATVTPNGHETTPPPRYTEASLVKRLEELGIGRPSTWASILQTIQDRGYVWKKGQALVPTWTAFAVVGLMEKHFDELVDYAFTAKVEEDLDAISRNERQKLDWLRQFYFGAQGKDEMPGLQQLVRKNLDEIDAAAINTFPLGRDALGNEIVVKPGKFGPYVKRGEDTAGVPEDLPPDELTVEYALRLLAAPKGDTPFTEVDGLPVFAKNGRFGPYVQWGTPESPPPGLAKPKMASLFKTMSLETLTPEQAKALLTLPRTVGVDDDGEVIVANNGRYGPFVQKGKEFRTLESEEALFTVTLAAAKQLLAAPKQFRRNASPTAKPPLREFPPDPISGRPVVVKEGRFGPYVTDGETNASLTRGDRLEAMPPERAYELLALRRASDAEKGVTGKKKAGRAPKAAPSAKPAPKKAAPKKAAPKAASDTAPAAEKKKPAVVRRAKGE